MNWVVTFQVLMFYVLANNKVASDTKVLDCLTNSEEVALLVVERTMQTIETKNLHGG
jgi:hypothetical protein